MKLNKNNKKKKHKVILFVLLANFFCASYKASFILTDRIRHTRINLNRRKLIILNFSSAERSLFLSFQLISFFLTNFFSAKISFLFFFAIFPAFCDFCLIFDNLIWFFKMKKKRRSWKRINLKCQYFSFKATTT